MLAGPFLTDIDARAAVKGSRDPLGQVSIWTRFGRHVVGNLSTVSTSVRDFTVLLLGLWLIERLGEDEGAQNEVEVFIRWEQLAGYARACHSKVTFRGIEKVRANLAAGNRVTVSADQRYQILGNQKIYGVWGLYTVPATSSALVTGSPLRLRPEVRAFVENTSVRALTRAGYRDGNAVRKILAAPLSTLYPEGKDAKLLQVLGQLLRPDRLSSHERAFYDEYLVRGGPEDETAGRQERLAALLERTLATPDYSLTGPALSTLALQAKDRDQALSLGWRLDRIRNCEAVMAPAYRLFLFLLARDGKPLASVAEEVRKTWGDRVKAIQVDRFRELVPELRTAVGDDLGSERWAQIAASLATGEYATAIHDLIDHNAFVMKQRGSGAPWVELQKDRLRVRFRADLAALPGRADMQHLWRFPYFLDSLRAVTAQVREAA